MNSRMTSIVAFWPERAVIEGAVIRSVPFFWERPRIITCISASPKIPVRPRMPGATLTACAVLPGLLRIASMLLRVTAWSPLRSPLVTMFETWASAAPTPGIAVPPTGLMKSAPTRAPPLPMVPPVPKTLFAERPKGLTIQSNPSSSLFSWLISTNFVVILTCFGWPTEEASMSCSILSSSEGVFVISRVPDAPSVAELPSEKITPAFLSRSMMGGRGTSKLFPPPPELSAKGSASTCAAPSPPALSVAAKSGGTRKVRVNRSSPVSVWGTRVTAKSSTL